MPSMIDEASPLAHPKQQRPASKPARDLALISGRLTQCRSCQHQE